MKKVAFVILYFIFLAGIAEVAARILLKINQKYDIEMSRYGLELKVPSANSKLAFLHRKNSSSRLMGVDISINSMGVRGPEFSQLPAEGVRRLLFLGDSLTLGWGVPEENTFSRIIEQKLKKSMQVEVINAGHGNFNTEQEVEFYFSQGVNWGAKEVILFFFINDAEVTQQISDFAFFGYSRFITLIWSFQRQIHVEAEHLPFETYYKSLFRPENPGWSAAKSSLIQITDHCKKNNIAFKVVLLPELHNLKNYPFIEQHRLVTDFLTAQSVRFLDLINFFQGYENPEELWVAKDDAHPNKLGHELISKYIVDFVSP
jgi:GDSL-like Lipase/Acylhydrolase family